MPNIKPKITALVLAAGKGTRFGGDKLLHAIPYTNEDGTVSTSAIGLISALNVKPHVDEVLCVVRPNDTKLIALYEQYGFKVVINTEYEKGLSTSIKIGAQHIQSNHHIMVCLGDMPLIKKESYQSIVTQFEEHNHAVCRPIYLAKDNAFTPGHPAIFAHELKPLLMQLEGDQGAQPLIKSLPVHTFKLTDIGIVKDIDHQTDLPDYIL